MNDMWHSQCFVFLFNSAQSFLMDHAFSGDVLIAWVSNNLCLVSVILVVSAIYKCSSLQDEMTWDQLIENGEKNVINAIGGD